jgi:hypothetical protein
MRDYERLLAPLHPDEHALVPLFRANIDESMLREIAEADYGWKADACHVLLQHAWNTGGAASDDYDLREVLELIRWSEPEDPAWSPGGQGARGHWMRLFACAQLLRLAAKYSATFSSECDTLAQFVSSAIELGRDVARPAAGFLAWRFLARPPDNEDRAFLAFAILLLAASLERGEDRGPWLKELASWVEDEESMARAANGCCANLPGSDEWLIGLTLYRQRDAVWRSLAHRILARPESRHPVDADEDLRLIGELVAGI